MASNKNIIVRIQNWIESASGQTFLNYAYSWGAAVVILGALFKLTHIPGANAMLFIGMGAEVLVFFISGFDRPAGLKENAQQTETAERVAVKADAESAPVAQAGGYVPVGGPVIIGNVGGNAVPTSASAVNAVPVAEGVEQPVAVASSGAAASPIDMKLLAEVVSASNAEFMEAARNACTPEMKEAAEQYVEELKNLTETLSRVAEQAEHMTRDSKEMDNLNRTLTGINTIYEMQLKSISTQVGTIDQINEQTRKMARQIEELNAIYNRMIQALTVNMKQAPGI